MKKFFKYALMFAMAITMGAGFTSCSDDDDDDDSAARAEEQNTAISSITSVYLNSVVYPTYSSLASETENLYNLISALKTKLKAGTTVEQSEINAICESYLAARNYWEESEAFLYGAASDFEIDPHIDTWPLDVATLATDLNNDTKIAALDESDGIEYARENLTAENLGFHGIEFIFFRNGSPRDVAIFNNDAVEDYSYQGTNYFSGMNVTGKEEVIFATAVAGDLRDKCFQLEVAWEGSSAPAAHIERVATCAASSDDFQTVTNKGGISYGEDLLAAGQTSSTQASWKKVMETILVSGCSNICAEVADQKMGQAYRSATGQAGDEDDPNYIESPYSYNSFTDFYDNIISIKNCLYGNLDGTTWSSNSVMAYLVTYNSEMATELNSRLNTALSALQACKDSGTPFVLDPGASYVNTAMQAVNSLDDYLNSASSWILAN